MFRTPYKNTQYCGLGIADVECRMSDVGCWMSDMEGGMWNVGLLWRGGFGLKIRQFDNLTIRQFDNSTIRQFEYEKMWRIGD